MSDKDPYQIKYFKLVKKDCRRSIIIWTILLVVWVPMFITGLCDVGLISLILLPSIIITVLAIINDINRYNNAALFLDDNEENTDE